MADAVKIPFSDVARISRWLSPFGTATPLGGNLLSAAAFGERRVSVCDRVVGADAPWAGGAFLLPASALAGPLLSVSADVSVTVSEDGFVSVKAGAFRARFAPISPEAVPEWPKAPTAKAWHPFPEAAWAAVSAVAFTADAGRPGCAGVALKGGVAYATDGVRAARAAAKGAPDGFLPLRLLDAVRRAADDPPDAVAFAEDRAWLQFGDRTCWSLLPVEEFPAQIVTVLAKYAQAAGKGYAVKYALAEAVAAVVRVKEFSDSASGVAVRAEPGKGMLTFSAKGPRGEAEEAVPAEVVIVVDVDADGAKLEEMIGMTETFAVAPDGSCLIFRKPGFEAMLMCLAR